MTEGHTGGRSAPDPREATDPAAFIAQLQALKDWSGLTYRELSARAEAVGDVLPRSTVANMLARSTVPREELLTAFVRACGVGPGALESWQVVRKELAVRGVHAAAGPVLSAPALERDGDEAEDGDAVDGPRWPGAQEPRPEPRGARPDPDSDSDSDPDPRRRIRRTLVALVAVAGLVLAAVSVVVALVQEGEETGHGPKRLTAPAAGDVRIRVIGSDLCLNERRGARTGQVHQVECAGADVPRYSLKDLGAGTWQIVSDHPDYGPGCSGIPSGGRIPDAALEDSECGDPTRVERFRLEAFGTPVTGYRIVPVGSATPGTCVTVLGDRTAPWSRLAQAPCRPDAPGQLFSFDRRATAP
ncbi:XRE family transcriptional regulator [Streptomyces sp. ISL-36]|uniref:RICIN domain-containing protein n=1 Tax=Streptomyces sp. ISL-36 TaxID=2819182 RepID=UPI001BECE832|nr:RICIN domain-containing protein [Streptomyces sp. ISL-36]MBT2439728.1 XRE family transcriptional regulator [Streptomyces sp. ISL-36]